MKCSDLVLLLQRRIELYDRNLSSIPSKRTSQRVKIAKWQTTLKSIENYIMEFGNTEVFKFTTPPRHGFSPIKYSDYYIRIPEPLTSPL